MSWLARHAGTFGRSQLTALLATVVDYGSLLAMVEWGGVYYVVAVGIAAFLGALTNFFANRHWAFHSQGKLGGEMSRYVLVSAGSLGWNVFLVWVVTEFIGLPYYWSKLAVAIVVGIVWNYPLQRFWVFVETKAHA